jgi:sulfur-carrier protein
VRVSILYFAWVREGTGLDGETLDIPEDVATLGALADWLALRHPVFADTARLRGAIDQVMATMDAPIAGAKEIAFFPPVTGG